MKQIVLLALLICAGGMIYYGIYYAATANLPVSFDRLKCDWFEIELTKGYGKGFYPLFLPFSQTIGGKTTMTYAFPFLLSYKFDWVEDNYCTRHPYFIYKRDRKHFQNFRGADTAFIKGYAKSWRGTHVVGGSVVSSGNFWGGQLQVFGADGTAVFEKKYDLKYGYFELMGQMVIDWITFRKQECSDLLKAELILPMTTDMRTIQHLEVAALVEEKSNMEWAIYQKILEMDPNFAEVRAWRANQMCWFDGDNKKAAFERGLALKSHLVVQAITEFQSYDCPDKSLVDMFGKVCLKKVEEMVTDHVGLAIRDIDFYQGNPGWSLETLGKVEKLAKKAPYHGYLLYQMAHDYERYNMPEKSVPLYINSLQSGYLWGTNDLEVEMFDAIIRLFETKNEKSKANIARKLKKKYFEQN